MAHELIVDIGLIIVVATVLAYLSKTLKQPPIIAYIIAGIILGPFGFSLITNQQEILIISELGIAFLLFIIGIDLDTGRLKKLGSVIFGTGVLQIGITFAIGYFVSYLLGFTFIQGFYMGLVVAFSSTMLVVKLLSDQRRINSLQGRLFLGILILQDIVIVIILSFIGHVDKIFTPELASILINGVGLVSIALILNKFIFPSILKNAAKTRELFFLVSLSTAFFFIGFSQYLGFSMAIGGFIGGLALATYPYNIEISNHIKPLRDFFIVMFFAGLGMQLNIFLIPNILDILSVFLVILLVVKPLIIFSILALWGYGSRIPTIVGLGLGEASEFSFVFAKEGMDLGHISYDFYSLIITLTLISIAIAPYLFYLARKISDYLAKYFPKGFRTRNIEKYTSIKKDKMKNHYVLFGCHRTGKELLERLNKKSKIVVVDHDPEVIESLKKQGYDCVYGEADNEFILKQVNADKAKVVVITLGGLMSNAYITDKIRSMGSKAKIIAKAFNPEDALKLYDKGADFVIFPEMLSGEKIYKELNKKDRILKKTKTKQIEKLKKDAEDDFFV